MKSKFFTLVTLLVSSFVFLGIPNQGLSMASIPTIQEMDGTTDCTLTLFAPLWLSDLPDMSRKEVEQKLNRRLKLKERLTLNLLKRHAKRMDGLEFSNNDCSKLEKKARNSIIFGIIGLFIAGIIFGILAIIAGAKAVKLAKASPDCPDAEKKRKKGTIGIVLGVLDIIGAIILLAIIL